jgi:tRNA dimethylallyltransferase
MNFLTNDYAILVGGSGLYVNAVLKGFDSFPEIDPSVREAVNAQYEKLGIVYLQEQLKALDFEYFETITKENPQTLQTATHDAFCRSMYWRQPIPPFKTRKNNERSFTLFSSA